MWGTLVCGNSLWLGICGIHINSSIVDEGAQAKKVPYNIENQSIPIQHPWTSMGFLTLLMEPKPSWNNHSQVIIWFATFSPSQWMSLRKHHKSLATCNVYLLLVTIAISNNDYTLLYVRLDDSNSQLDSTIYKIGGLHPGRFNIFNRYRGFTH